VKQFDFGKNWQAFSEQRVDTDRLVLACQSLHSLLQKDSLAGLSFLDVGCGSGLFSIAAYRLGASRVVGIDVNPRCIEISQHNRDRLIPRSPIEFHIASALQPNQLERFGKFNIVYAWGSLHHSGSMWEAIRNVGDCVADEGSLIIAVYNKHITAPLWKAVKWFYNQAPRIVQRVMIFLFAGVIYVAKFLVTGSNPLHKERGMDFWFDVIDWVGGYPYEYAAPAEVEQFLCAQRFSLRRYVAAQVPTGCNEFVFSKLDQ
jgi:2-polyprenyl-6-hydroxyphenyl methylase/3-demethylubiquinone-9 3-methyltransferase